MCACVLCWCAIVSEMMREIVPSRGRRKNGSKSGGLEGPFLIG